MAPNFGVPFSLCIHPLSQKYQSWHGNTCGEVTCFRGQPHAHTMGRASALPDLVGSVLFTRTHSVAELPNLMWYHMSGGVCILGSAVPPIPRQRSSGAPQFCGFCIYASPLMQNDQIWHGNTYGEGVFLGGQPRHCICTNASRGLSAIAEFLIYTNKKLCGCTSAPKCNLPERGHSLHKPHPIGDRKVALTYPLICTTNVKT